MSPNQEVLSYLIVIATNKFPLNTNAWDVASLLVVVGEHE